MMITQPKVVPRWIFPIIALIILVVIATAYYYDHSQNLEPTQAPPSSENADSSEVREQVNEESSDPYVANSPIFEASKDRDVLTTPKPNLKFEIRDTRQESSTLIVDTIIEPQIMGNCILNLTREGYEKLSAESQIVDVDSKSSECRSLAVSISNIAKGDWTLTVKINTDNGVATSTKLVSIK